MKDTYYKRHEDPVPIGILGTTVAVDCYSCIVDGPFLQACQLFQWYRTENDVPAADMATVKSKETGKHGKEDRLDGTDKPDPIREHGICLVYGILCCMPRRGSQSRSSNMKLHNVASETVQ